MIISRTQTTDAEPAAKQIHRSRRFGHSGGFSLVEVTLVIGIMAIAILPLLAMLPLGLNLHRQSIDSTLTAQIVSRVTHEIQQTDFSTLLVQAAPLVYFFDDQGNLLPAATDSRRLYDAQATINKLPSLPGGSTTPSLARVRIDIAANPGKAAAIFGTGTDGKCTNMNAATYFAFASKND